MLTIRGQSHWMSHSRFRFPGKMLKTSIPNSSPDGFCGGAGYGINAVCPTILFIIQEPARVCKATDLNPRISQFFQLFSHSIHIQEDSCSTSTAMTSQVFEAELLHIVAWRTMACRQGLHIASINVNEIPSLIAYSFVHSLGHLQCIKNHTNSE